MTTVFDGMATLLNEVFGDVVSLLPQSGGSIDIQAVFREEPVEIIDDQDRATLTHASSIRVQQDIADTLERGDVIAPGNGHTYSVGARYRTTGNPSSDAFFIFELEKIS